MLGPASASRMMAVVSPRLLAANAIDDPDEGRIEHDVAHAVVAEVGVRRCAVAVLGPDAWPKASSGKRRRSNPIGLM